MWSKILLFFQLVKRWQVTWRLRHRRQNNATENKWHTGKKQVRSLNNIGCIFVRGRGSNANRICNGFSRNFHVLTMLKAGDQRVFTKMTPIISKTCDTKSVLQSFARTTLELELAIAIFVQHHWPWCWVCSLAGFTNKLLYTKMKRRTLWPTARNTRQITGPRKPRHRSESRCLKYL